MILQEQLSRLKSAAASLPNTEGVSEAFALIDTGAPFIELFFGSLSDPAWLPLLERKGYFSGEIAELTTDHREEHKRRLPLLALARFAETKPHMVSAILLRMPRSLIVARSDEVLRCLAGIKDRKAIASLRPLAIELAEATRNVTSVWVEEILKSWVNANAHLEAKAVLRAFIGSTVRSSSEQRPRLDSHWQIGEIDEKLVGILAKDRPQDVAVMYFEALSRWAALRRNSPGMFGRLEDSDPAQDLPPVYWLQDFKQPSRDSRNLEETLAVRLYQTCAQIFSGDDQSGRIYLDALLRSDRWELFNRLRWQLYADYPAATISLARSDVLEIVDQMGRLDYGHQYEFAQMLSSQAAFHGSKFLSLVEVERLVAAVLSGPLDKTGGQIKDMDEERFWRRQLQPIEPILPASIRERLKLTPIPLEAYKPFHTEGARFIEQTSPHNAAALGNLVERDLWALLNTWKPGQRDGKTWWVEESIDALADEFAILVEQEPHRFLAKDTWWRQLVRPAFSNRILERAISRLSAESKSAKPPDDADWDNWLGIANWVIIQSVSSASAKNEAAPEWSTRPVARFLKASVSSSAGGSSDRFAEIKSMLRQLLESEDATANRDVQSWGDWLTVAINSVRGDSVDALLDIALRQVRAKEPAESWIFPAIQRCLASPTESPAIFALLGAKLRLMLYLFEAQLKDSADLLFPLSRPEHRDAAVQAHFQYDNPARSIIEAFPSLLKLALDRLENASREKETEKKGQREFDSRLGMHIAFYYWHSAFAENGNETLDRYFRIASANTRATVIEQIGSAFDVEKPEDVSQGVSARAMQIWDRRFDQIVSGNTEDTRADFQGELAAFTDWIRCECFPFEWRVRRVVSALNLLTEGPRPYRLTRYLGQQANTSNRQLDLLKVLEALVRKTNDEVRWSIQDKEIRPLLENAFTSDNPELRAQAEATLELLLRKGFLSFLDIGKASDSAQAK